MSGRLKLELGLIGESLCLRLKQWTQLKHEPAVAKQSRKQEIHE